MIQRSMGILIGILTVTGLTACYSASPTTESNTASVVSPPSKPGKYRNGDWEYEYRVWGDSLRHAQGILKYKGKEVS